MLAAEPGLEAAPRSHPFRAACMEREPLPGAPCGTPALQEKDANPNPDNPNPNPAGLAEAPESPSKAQPGVRMQL